MNLIACETGEGIKGVWWSLPRDVERQVFVQLVEQHERGTTAVVRLVCKGWLQAVDFALEDVELYSWPSRPAFLERFVSVRHVTLAGPDISDDAGAALPVFEALLNVKSLRSLSATYAGPSSFVPIGLLTQLTQLLLQRGHETGAAEQLVLPGQLAFLTGLVELRLNAILPDYHVLAALPLLSRLEFQGQTVRPAGASLWVSCNPLVGLEALSQLKVLCAKANYGVSRLPVAIGNLSSLEELDLSRNMLWSLPAAIGNLSHLSRLDVSSNCLSALPAELGLLHRLRHLDMSTNSRLQLPTTISGLTSLEHLNLNWIWSDVSLVFAHAASFVRLSHLHLVGNGMSQLPASVGQLRALSTLTLSMNHLTQLPDAITQLEHLEVLDLSDNRIRELPEGLGHLHSLSWLGVRSNALVRLPISMGSMSSLASLDASMNQLEGLPDSITRCKALTSLCLNFNPLATLPEGCRMLSALRTLELHYVPLGQAEVEDIRTALPLLRILTGCLCPRRCCTLHNTPEARAERAASASAAAVPPQQRNADAVRS